MKRNSYYLLVMIILLVWACSPKTAKETVKEEVKTETPPPLPPAPKETTCPTFDDAANKDQAIEDYVLCKDQIKKKNYEAAFPLWEKVYANSPAADGRRNLVFMWGVEIYNDKFKKATDPAEKKKHVDRVMELYDELSECYPKEKGFVYGRKAFDMFYNYPDFATQQEKYDLFKKSIDTEGMKTQPFVLNPFVSLVREQYEAKAISMGEAQKYAKLIQDILDNGLKTASGNVLENFKIVDSYTPFRLAEFESVKGFYDCNYYKNKYLQEYEENKGDCEVIIDVYSTLRWGNCPEVDAKLTEMNAAYDANCVEKVVVSPGNPTPPPSSGPSCNDYLRGGEYQKAVDCYKERYNSSSDSGKKAKYAYAIASIYYSKFKKFSEARSWAEKASSHDSSWGKPYLLIGDMYASSGPLCGPGRGWDSQVVIWPAMDMWEKAKRDPDTAAKAQKKINQYSQYLPDKEQCFLRSKSTGDAFKVGCWIQRNTSCRCR